MMWRLGLWAFCCLFWVVFVVLVLFSTIRLFFPPFNHDLGTMPTRRPHSWKKKRLHLWHRSEGAAQKALSIHHAGQTTIWPLQERCAKCFWQGLLHVKVEQIYSQPKTSKPETVGRKQNVIFQLCHILVLGEICLHGVFRACYRDQIKTDLITVLVRRHCRVGGSPSVYARVAWAKKPR